jgi:hypothetical protein
MEAPGPYRYQVLSPIVQYNTGSRSVRVYFITLELENFVVQRRAHRPWDIKHFK